MGINHMAEFMKLFGYGEATGIDIPGEKRASMPRPNGSAAPSNARGPGVVRRRDRQHGHRRTDHGDPLQQAHFTAKSRARPGGRNAAAVSGYGRRIDCRRSRPAQLVKPIGVGTANNGRRVRRMVGALGPGGTAYASGVGPSTRSPARRAPHSVHDQAERERAAKIQDERKRDHAWFIAYAPADDPKIAVSVLVENAGFGASAAAPLRARCWMPTFLESTRRCEEGRRPGA